MNSREPDDDAAFAIDPDAVDPDEEALRWAGDEERGVAGPRRGRLGPGEEESAASEGTGGEAADAEAPDAESAAAESPLPRSATRTAATVLFGAVYLAIVLGWVLSVQSTSSGSRDLLVDVSWQFGEFLAMVSGLLWFGAVLALTRASSTLVRVLWWALGALLLVPWPLVLVVLAEASS